MAGVGTPAHAGPPGPPGRAGGSAARAGAGQAAPEGGEEDPPGAPPGGGPRGMLAGRTRGAAPTALAHRGWKQQARAAGHGPAGSPAWEESSAVVPGPVGIARPWCLVQAGVGWLAGIGPLARWRGAGAAFWQPSGQRGQPSRAASFGARLR